MKQVISENPPTAEGAFVFSTEKEPEHPLKNKLTEYSEKLTAALNMEKTSEMRREIRHATAVMAYEILQDNELSDEQKFKKSKDLMSFALGSFEERDRRLERNKILAETATRVALQKLGFHIIEATDDERAELVIDFIAYDQSGVALAVKAVNHTKIEETKIRHEGIPQESTDRQIQNTHLKNAKEINVGVDIVEIEVPQKTSTISNTGPRLDYEDVYIAGTRAKSTGNYDIITSFDTHTGAPNKKFIEELSAELDKHYTQTEITH